MNLNFHRLPRHKGHHFFLFWRAQSWGDWGETLPNKEARGGRWEGKEKGVSRFSLSIVHINRAILLEYEGGASAWGRSRGLCRPAPGYLPSSVLFFFFASFRSWKKARFKSVSRFLVLPLFEHSYVLHESLTVPFLI